MAVQYQCQFLGFDGCIVIEENVLVYRNYALKNGGAGNRALRWQLTLKWLEKQKVLCINLGSGGRTTFSGPHVNSEKKQSSSNDQ